MPGTPGLDPTGGTLTAVSDALGAVEGGYQMIKNIGQEKKDRAALAQIQDPFYKIQDQYYENRNLAANEAQGGMPAASKDYVTGETQRGLSAGLSGTLQSGGNANDIAKIFDVYNRSIDRTGAEDADQHIKNIQYYQQANKDLAGQATTQWAINKYQPAMEKRRQLNQNIANEQTNAANGANTAIGSVGALGTSLSNSSMLNNLFKPAATTDTAMPGTVSGGNIPNFQNPAMVSSTTPIPTNNNNTVDTSPLTDWLNNRQIKI